MGLRRRKYLEEKKAKFADIHNEVKQRLQKDGWKLSKPLKISHATDRDGFRVWFKKQAIYTSHGTRFGDAHTLTYDDLRDLSIDNIMSMIERRRKG